VVATTIAVVMATFSCSSLFGCVCESCGVVCVTVMVVGLLAMVVATVRSCKSFRHHMRLG